MTITYGGYRLHPACALFNPMAEPELAELAEDIRKHGLREPIVLLDGAILDGRNRLLACQRADVKPTFIDWDGSCGSPTLFSASVNNHRRHMTPGQRAMLADDMRPLLEAEAATALRENADRARAAATGPATDSSTKSIQRPRALGKTADRAAAAAGASSRSAERARELKEKAPDLADEVRAGKPMKTALREANERLTAGPGVPLDGLGRTIPPPLLEAWIPIKEASSAVVNLITAAQGEWTKQEKKLVDLAKTSRAAAKYLQDARALMKGIGGDALQNFSGRLREIAPFAVCTNCSGGGACPGKKCQRIRLAGADRGTCNCKAKLCGNCDGTGLVTGKQKAAAKHESKKAS